MNAMQQTVLRSRRQPGLSTDYTLELTQQREEEELITSSSNSLSSGGGGVSGPGGGGGTSLMLLSSTSSSSNSNSSSSSSSISTSSLSSTSTPIIISNSTSQLFTECLAQCLVEKNEEEEDEEDHEIPYIPTSGQTDDGAGVIVPLDESDFECALCYRLFYRPVTTVCGHTYCKECILTSLNYSTNCPICRRKLSTKQNSKEFDCAVNITLTTILEKHFTCQYKLREEEEMQVALRTFSKDSDVDVPEQAESNPTCSNWYWSALLCDV